MQSPLWVFCIGAIAAIVLVSTLSILVITNQRTEIISLHKQVADQTGTVARLNATITDTNNKLTFLAQKVNPLIGAECHIDRIFPAPSDVPKDYKGYVFVVYDFPRNDYFGLGIICR